jgi:hypothetical protein
MPGRGMGITGQFRRPLYHLLRHMAVVARQRPPLGPLPWLHAHRPFAAKANSPPRPQPTAREAAPSLASGYRDRPHHPVTQASRRTRAYPPLYG